MMGTMFGADGPGQKYGEEGKNGVTAKCREKQLYTSLFYTAQCMSIPRAALMTAMWATGASPPILR